MADKEIALIQVRMGKQRDLPDALEIGQLGFSTDVCRVFVGLPSNIQPASLVAGRNWDNAPNSGKENVELITEFTPYPIINKLVHKPYLIVLKPNTSTPFNLESTSRLFIEYIATSDSEPLLESGIVKLVANQGTVMSAQQNDTNNNDGIPFVNFRDPSFDETNKIMTVNIENNSNIEINIEFLTRGWDKPLV